VRKNLILMNMKKNENNVRDTSNNTRNKNCFECGNEIEKDELVCCIKSECQQQFHIVCLAKSFLKDTPNELIPTCGDCPACNQNMSWSNIIREKRNKMKRKMNDKDQNDEIIQRKKRRKNNPSQSDSESEISNI